LRQVKTEIILAIRCLPARKDYFSLRGKIPISINKQKNEGMRKQEKAAASEVGASYAA